MNYFKSISKVENITDFLCNILSLICGLIVISWYFIFGYYIVVLVTPTMSFWGSLGDFGNLLGTIIPESIYNFGYLLINQWYEYYITNNPTERIFAINLRDLITGIFVLIAYIPSIIFVVLSVVILNIWSIDEDVKNYNKKIKTYTSEDKESIIKGRQMLESYKEASRPKSNPRVENEVNWVMGLVNNNDMIKVELEANAIAAAVKDALKDK